VGVERASEKPGAASEDDDHGGLQSSTPHSEVGGNRKAPERRDEPTTSRQKVLNLCEFGGRHARG
jgi:hypothetical protein